MPRWGDLGYWPPRNRSRMIPAGSYPHRWVAFAGAAQQSVVRDPVGHILFIVEIEMAPKAPGDDDPGPAKRTANPCERWTGVLPQ